MSVPVDAVQAALESTDQGIKNLDTFLAELDAKIEAARKDLALPPGESVIDLGPDAVEAEAEEEREPDSSQVVMEGHLEFMRRNGYLDENNKWTGLQPDEKAPDFVRIRLKAIVEAAGDDPGRV